MTTVNGRLSSAKFEYRTGYALRALWSNLVFEDVFFENLKENILQNFYISFNLYAILPDLLKIEEYNSC